MGYKLELKTTSFYGGNGCQNLLTGFRKKIRSGVMDINGKIAKLQIGKFITIRQNFFQKTETPCCQNQDFEPDFFLNYSEQKQYF